MGMRDDSLRVADMLVLAAARDARTFVADVDLSLLWTTVVDDLPEIVAMLERKG
jgi:hypothetical protein